MDIQNSSRHHETPSSPLLFTVSTNFSPLNPPSIHHFKQHWTNNHHSKKHLSSIANKKCLLSENLRRKGKGLLAIRGREQRGTSYTLKVHHGHQRSLSHRRRETLRRQRKSYLLSTGIWSWLMQQVTTGMYKSLLFSSRSKSYLCMCFLRPLSHLCWCNGMCGSNRVKQSLRWRLMTTDNAGPVDLET